MSESSKSGKSRIGLWIVGTGVVLTVLLIVFMVLAARTTVEVEAYDAIPPEWINGNELGDPEAMVVLDAWEDFLCPHCGEFNSASKDRLVEEFVQNGQVKFVYHFFPLQIFAPNSFAAARAGLCVTELSDQFWIYHDTMFFGERGANRYSIESLTELASSLGIREGNFVECMGSTSTQQAIDRSIQDGIDAGVQSTPALFINGIKYEGNATDYDALKTALNNALQS